MASCISDLNEYDSPKNNWPSNNQIDKNMSPAHDMSRESGHKDKDHRADIDKTSFKHKVKDKPETCCQ